MEKALTNNIVSYQIPKVNPKISTWTKHKAMAAFVAKHMMIDERVRKRGEMMKNCGEKLIFEVKNGVYQFKSAWLCRDRLCPICAWRLSIKRCAEMAKTLSLLHEREPDTKAIHIVLTVKNCALEDLRSTIETMTRGFTRLKKLKSFRDFILGYARSVEVTYNAETDTYHPHIHCICIVKNSYSRQISVGEWSEMWSDSARLFYMPIIWASKTYPKTADITSSMMMDYQTTTAHDAIMEAIKYAMKPSSLVATAQAGDLGNIAQAIAGFRLISYGGILKSLRAEIKLSDEDPHQMPSCELNPSAGMDQYTACYQWAAAQRCYLPIRAE